MRYLSLVIVFGAVSSFAQQGPPRGPPPEALAACSGQASGAACSFSHDGRDVTGTCRPGPQGEQIACAPAGGPGGQRHGPPAEALAACANQSEGAACAFSVGDRNLTGTCFAPPDGKALACRPARPPAK